MRWLAFFLVMANVWFLGWQLWFRGGFEEEPLRAPVKAAASLDRLDDMILDDFSRRVPGPLGPPGGRIADAVCFAVGPLDGKYSEGSAMGRVREWLQSRGGRVALRSGKYHELGYYWVYFPPVGTRDAAQGRVRELVANSFRDAVVIPEGNMKNAVSIGVYGLRTVLERDLTRLKAKGFEPEVQRVRRTGRSIWFTAHFSPGYEFPESRFSVAFEGLEAVDTQCPPLAAVRPPAAVISPASEARRSPLRPIPEPPADGRHAPRY